jgi:hypothetical protein
VIVVGTITSGCVRATVVDAFSLDYRVILAEEGCFDRSETSHASACATCTPNTPSNRADASIHREGLSRFPGGLIGAKGAESYRASV